jgi:[acyl-carrier-protein] S-malonyltransferase
MGIIYTNLQRNSRIGVFESYTVQRLRNKVIQRTTDKMQDKQYPSNHLELQKGNNKNIAFLFPGQGAQYVGMGRDFYDSYEIARRTFEEADELLNTHFSKLIFEGPTAELTLTKNSQLAIYITSIAILRTMQEQFPNMHANVCAGLSLGEYTALTACSIIDFKECLPLVRARALYMNAACESIQGTMQVILGLDAKVIEQTIKELNPPHQVWVANLNCPGQVVIAGTTAGIEVAVQRLKEKGAKRALPLDVSGAFHSGLMKEAQDKLEPKITALSLKNSSIDIVMNVPGDYVQNLDEMRYYMISQVTSTVRWEKGIRAMMGKGIDVFLEIGCGKTLSGMNKKIGVEGLVFNVEKISDLDEFCKQKDALYAAIER